MRQQGIVAHERRIIRRLEARGETGLGEALVRLDGAVVGRRFRIESLYAVGSEGAVYLARDIEDLSAPMRVAKVALLPLHRPFDLTDEELRRRRDCLREEATNLARADSRYMPTSFGLFHFANPALESDWGGEFAEPEPCIVMEKIPGFDLDLWLARMHSSRVPKVLLRRQLDHVAVVVLSGLMDLQDKGFFYTDLRPGNVRIRGRSRERVRLLDAGSLVRVDDLSGKFPHVPAYLPPELFETSHAGGSLLPTPAVQAIMAGRTLFEVATGRVPLPGEPVETAALYGLNVSPSVAETIERLCRSSFPDVATALQYLSENFRHDAADRAPPTPSASARAAARDAAREAGQSTTVRDGSQSASRAAAAEADVPAAARVPDAPPITFSLPPARPRLDLHSMLATARGPSPSARGVPRPGERPAQVAGARPLHEDPQASVAPQASHTTPARTVSSTASRSAPAAALQRPQPAASSPALAPRASAPVAPLAAAPAAPPAPAKPARPVLPPVRPLRPAPAVVRDEEPVDYEFAAAYAAAIAKGQAPPPVVSSPTKPVTTCPQAGAPSEPITLEAPGGAPSAAALAAAAQAQAAAQTGRPEPTRPLPSRTETQRPEPKRPDAQPPGSTRSATPRKELPRIEMPRADAPRADTPRVETPRAQAPRADVPRADVPRADVARPVARAVTAPPLPPPPLAPNVLPLAQAFAAAPKPVLPPVPEGEDDIPTLHPGRVTQNEFAESEAKAGFPEPRPQAPAPRAAQPVPAKAVSSKAASSKQVPSKAGPAPATADVPVVEPVSTEMRSAEIRKLRAEPTADVETVLPAPHGKPLLVRLLARLFGRG